MTGFNKEILHYYIIIMMNTLNYLDFPLNKKKKKQILNLIVKIDK